MQRDKIYISQNEFNRLVYHYLRNNLTKETVEIYKLNVKFSPNSANVYYSLDKEANDFVQKENFQKAIDLAVKTMMPMLRHFGKV